MSLFTKKQNRLLSVATGTVVSLDKVPDMAFSGRILGDGYAVLPETGEIFSPADGVLENVTDTLHAFSIKTEDSAEVLVHIGVDTVKMRGDGFRLFASQGEKLKAGQKIAEVDLGKLEEYGYPSITSVVITNMDEVASLRVNSGKAEGGKSEALMYKERGRKNER